MMRWGHGIALAAVLALTGCSGGVEPSSLGATEYRSPLANNSAYPNSAYPNVASDVARQQSGVKSASEVRDIETQMMGLAAEQDGASRQQPASVINDMRALAARNKKMLDDEAQAQANGN